MSKLGVMKYLVVYLGILAMGILIGMTFQQAITQSTLMKVAGSLDGVQIDIDLNETQIIKGITDFYKPYFEEMINKSEDTVIFNATVDELGGAKLMGFELSDLLLLPIFILLVMITGYKRWEFWAMLIMMGAWGLRLYYEGLHFDDDAEKGTGEQDG